jgi:hypothetical protein
MNRARLARRWQEASGDPVRMAEALGEEINDPAARLVSRDFLDARLAEFEARLLERLDSHFWRLAGVIMAQSSLIMIAVLGLYFR